MKYMKVSYAALNYLKSAFGKPIIGGKIQGGKQATQFGEYIKYEENG